MTREQILTALENWIAQRPGLEFGNYGELKSYRAELRQIAKDRRDAETLLRAVALRPSITAEDLIAATRAYSGRLQIKERPAGKTVGGVFLPSPVPDAPPVIEIDYCTGQYWPTEYRKAVCAVLASALWADEGERLKATYADGSTLYPTDYMRNSFRREFGRSIAQRWFN